ncbi:MAG: DUF6318 family protein [Cellulomonas sp.]|nr:MULTISPECIES: DUF6318 family protein [Cellulomonas]MCR6648877.1 DUF6318 family protein [Cellulomonas sp.]
MRHPKLVAAVTLAGALVVIAGCDSSTPTADPTTARPSATVSASPERPPTPATSPTPDIEEFDATTPPERPSGLDGPPSEETAAQVGVFYISLLPYVFATGDREDWDGLATANCTWCAKVSAFVRDEQSAGKYRVGGEIEVVDVQGFDNGDGKYLAVVRVSEQPSKVLDASGKVVEEYEAPQEAKMQVGLLWTGDSWAVDGVAVDTEGSS